MGCLFSSKQKEDDFNRPLDFEKMKNLCPSCSNTAILFDLHSDNEHIRFNCECNKSKIEDYNLRDYFEIIKDKSKKDNNQTIETVEYCELCKKFCFKEDSDLHKNHNVQKKNKEQIMKIIEGNKNDTNVKNTIIEKCENICKMIVFNQIVLNTFENNKYNYFHAKSIINIANSILKEKERKIEEIEYVMKDLKKRREDHNEQFVSFSKYSFDIINNELRLKPSDEKEQKEQEELKKQEDQKREEFQEKEELERINKIKNVERICLFPDDKSEPLNSDKVLGDDGFISLSKILFTQLKEIDLAENKIKEVNCLENMILPYLEYLDMSDNIIEDIKPIADLKCEKLKEICLQNNKIKTIKHFENSYFPDLELLRVENNKFEKHAEENSIVIKKYKGIIIIEAMLPSDFDKKYKTTICSGEKDKKKIEEYKDKLQKEIDDENNKLKREEEEKKSQENNLKENENLQANKKEENLKENQKKDKFQIEYDKKIKTVKKIYVYEINYGKLEKILPESVDKFFFERQKEMLKDLYLTIPKRNKIEKIALFNCKIEDASILAKFPFYNTKSLDLSLNKIKNINFLLKMRTKNLKNLYLNHNKINDIRALTKITAGKTSIKALSLNKNNIGSVYEQKRSDLEKLAKKGIDIDIYYMEGDYEDDQFSDDEKNQKGKK
jgi:Leucine-rich repeat (LRR) protein